MKDKEFEKELEIAILEFDYELKMKELRNKFRNELSHYESLYQCLCCSFSDAYLEGSQWYVGEKLTEWFYTIDIESKSLIEKLEKYEYIKEIIDMFMKYDSYNDIGN